MNDLSWVVVYGVGTHKLGVMHDFTSLDIMRFVELPVDTDQGERSQRALTELTKGLGPEGWVDPWDR